MDDSGDQDMYVSQLKEVFDSCDAGGIGMLNREELVELCSKLQLEDQAEELLKHLVGDSTKTLVDFDTFKEGFVMVLSSAVDLDNIEGLSDGEDNVSVGSINEVSIAEEVEVSPKYVKGNKKYGRRSRPDFDLSYTADYSDIDTDFSSHYGGNDTSRGREERRSDRSKRSERSWKPSKSLSFADDISEIFDGDGHNEDVFDREHKIVGGSPSSSSKRDIPMIVHETFEAEGQMNASMSLMESAPTEADQVQAIWDEVGVGGDGFLDINDLATVCQHIGMEDMDDEELNNLFNKLDVDQDGKVGFQEFLEGLFRHEGPRPTPTTPLTSGLSTAQKAKLRMSMMGSAMDDPLYRTATPSFMLVPGTQLLTMLDHNNTGYVSPEDIVEQFAAQGIHNPVEVLHSLDVDTEAGKVSLPELSVALEHVLMTTGDTNGVYQAALTSYQSELKHLKSQLDSMTDERNKLRADTTEANQRNAMLVKEVDETHANIIKTNEAKLQAAEKKHQEKLGAMQAEVEKERQQMAAQAAKQRQRLEEEINQIKSGDAGLRERFTEMQKEITRLEQELTEAAEKLLENEKTILKQQRDLDGFQELEERLAELESNRETVSKQQEEYFEQNLKEYQEHVRVLQDQLDEITQENELLKHQTSERKIRRRGSKLQHSNKPSRVGSVLSDYTKPTISKRSSSGHSSSENESELEELDPQGKRRLPLTARSGGDGNSNEEEDSQRAKLEAEIESLKEKHSKELAESQTAFERDSKDIEFRYKMEITDLEDGFERQKEEMREEFQKEQQQLIEEVERRFGSEKQEMTQVFAQEKRELEELFSTETRELRDRLEAEYNVEMDNRIAEVKQKLLDEKAGVEKELSQEKSSLSEEIIRERNSAEIRLKKMQSDLELRFLEEKGEMQAQWERERAELELMYQEKVHELETLFVDGEVGLKGQLRRDFDELLAQHRAEIERNFLQEKEALLEGFELEKEALIEELEMEKAELLKSSKGDKTSLLQKAKEEKSELMKKHKREKLELAERHKKQVTDLEDRREQEKSQIEERMQRERQKFKQEREKLESRFRQDLSEMQMSLTVDKDELERSVHEEVEDKLKTDIRRELEKELVEQMEQFKKGYNEERKELVYQKEEMESKLQQAEVAAQEAVSVVTMHTLQATQKEAEADKAQLRLVAGEKEKLVTDLSDVNRRLLEAQMQLSVQETQHLRELQRVKGKQTEVSAKELQSLREDLLRKDVRLVDLERTVSEKDQEAGRLTTRAQEESREEVRRLQEAKAELERKQKKMRAMLDEYVRKLKDQLTRSTRSDIMVKELYMENCKLQTALQITEERQKNAERTCHNLTEKNQVYLRLIRKVSPAVL
ncbi:ninein-like isoform X2 [Patiria miniata]|uniref:EF-hand domain-containing protein n=1 Tax=Patiria miniata TaxID=46514 RepID=A0A914BED4_PATMI|nr:ninein-like isoform X2 [Patiria miniata]